MITVIADDRVDSDTGGSPMYRRAESPRPMPQIVRLPKLSFSVANIDAITDQSRVPGLVTIGPTIIVDVDSRIRGIKDERLLPQHVRVERPPVAEAAGLGALHHGDQPACGRIWLQYYPELHVAPLTVQSRYWLRSRGRKVPCPAAPRNSPSATTTRPREMVTSTLPVISIPS